MTYSIYPEWEGCYSKSSIDTPAFDLMPDLQYHAVVTDVTERTILVVPTFWLESRGRFVLYPHPEFNLHGMYPNEWTEAMYNRRRYPTTKFVEYQVDDFITEEAGIVTLTYFGFCYSLLCLVS